jgi:lipopolysaccharide transport system ATP-binding protein
VLLVDEVLAVGDEAFAHRCLRKIEELLASGRTLLLVSHSLSLMEAICDRVLWLDGGKARMVGEPRRVADAYREAVAEAEGRRHREEKDRDEEAVTPGDGASTSDAGAQASGDGPRRWGSRQAEIVGVRLLVGGEERYHLKSGEAATVELAVEARERLDDFVFGIALGTPRGVEVWGTNTDLEGWRSARLEGAAQVRVELPALQLAAGEYVLDVAVHARDGAPYDYRKGALSLSVTAPSAAIGVYRPPHQWRFAGGVRWADGD